ncbi:MAG: aldehyde dehydrogenase [Candidatus Magasanikbacteria bacterium]|nr:aldehyde dehydrogenase [Candidatus Magasanikbacteria bacterium]
MENRIDPAPHVIGGRDVWQAGVPRLHNSPRDARVAVTEFHMGGEAEVSTAAEAALAAFELWSRLSVEQRLDVVRRIPTSLRKFGDNLARAMEREVGKTRAGALGEIGKTVAIAEYYAAYKPDWFVQVMEPGKGVQRRVIKTPLGVVAVITAFNFPLALALWKIIPAILAGNAVIYKPSELTPYTAWLIMQVLKDAGVPDGVVNLVHGTELVGKAMIYHDAVKAVSFTGSVPVGDKIRCMAAERGIRAVCEKGGLNGILVAKMGQSRIPGVVQDAIAAAFSAGGQRCTAAKRLIVTEDLYEMIREELLRLVREVDVEDFVGPLVNGVALERALLQIQEGVRAGMVVLHGGTRLWEASLEHGHYMAPTIMEAGPDALDAGPLVDEVFGPILTLVRVRDYEEGVRELNRTEYGHCAALYTDNIELMARFPLDADVGMAHVNEHTLGGDPDMPFGGMKSSMDGPPEMGGWGLEFFCQLKAVYVNDGTQAVSATKR